MINTYFQKLPIKYQDHYFRIFRNCVPIRTTYSFWLLAHCLILAQTQLGKEETNPK